MFIIAKPFLHVRITCCIFPERRNLSSKPHVFLSHHVWQDPFQKHIDCRQHIRSGCNEWAWNAFNRPTAPGAKLYTHLDHSWQSNYEPLNFWGKAPECKRQLLGLFLHFSRCCGLWSLICCCFHPLLPGLLRFRISNHQLPHLSVYTDYLSHIWYIALSSFLGIWTGLLPDYCEVYKDITDLPWTIIFYLCSSIMDYSLCLCSSLSHWLSNSGKLWDGIPVHILYQQTKFLLVSCPGSYNFHGVRWVLLWNVGLHKITEGYFFCQ